MEKMFSKPEFKNFFFLFTIFYISSNRMTWKNTYVRFILFMLESLDDKKNDPILNFQIYFYFSNYRSILNLNYKTTKLL